MIQVNNPEPLWVGINTALPNRIIKLALEQKRFPELANLLQRYCHKDENLKNLGVI
jgi:sugar fermentation stimulation protein A